MNGLWMNQALVERLGWALIHSLWQGGIAAVLYGTARRALHRRSAELRYWVGFVLLLLMLVAPVFTTYINAPNFTAPTARLADARLLPVASRGQGGIVAAAVISGPGSAWAGRAAEVLESSLPWLVCAWFAGVLVFSARWIQGCRWVKRVRSLTVEPPDPAWVQKLAQLRWRMRVSRPVRLLQSALIEVPMVVGWLRPAILLPASSITGLTPEQLEAILAHELAHIRRYDYLMNAVQNLAETLLFYHPAVWWISRGVRQEREHCCDDLVVRVCRDRLVYARALFRLEELRSTPPTFALAASGGSLLQRIRRLVQPGGDPLPVGPREFGGLALVALGCVLFFTGLTFMFGQPVYRAVTRVRIDDFSRGDGQQAMESERSSSSYLVQTESALIRSDFILRPAAGALHVREVWEKREGRDLSEAAVLGLVRDHLRVRPVPNTSLIEIQVADENPDLAAAIANSVAMTYQNQREAQRVQLFNRGINLLKDRIDQENAGLRRAESNADYLRIALKVPDYLAPGDAPAPTLNAETLRKLEALRIESQAELARQQTLLQKLKSLPPGQLVQVIPSSGVSDTYLNNLLEQLSLTQQKHIGLAREFGPNHPEVLKTVAVEADLQQKIRERTEGILLGLTAKAEAAKQSIAQLQEQIETTEQSDSARLVSYRPYFEAKRALQDSERFRQVLLMKLASEQTDQVLSRSRLVEIVDRAVAPVRAIAPNRPRAGVLMTAGVALAVLGTVLVRRATPAKSV